MRPASGRRPRPWSAQHQPEHAITRADDAADRTADDPEQGPDEDVARELHTRVWRHAVDGDALDLCGAHCLAPLALLAASNQIL